MKNLEPSTHAADLSNRYTTARVLLSEEMYGEGYQSSGGRELAKELIPKLHLCPNKTLLEVGCGTGGTALLAAKEFGLKVTAVDQASDNIALCQRRVASHSLEEKISLTLGDATTVTFKEKHHGLWCSDVLMYVADKSSLFKNVARALHTGARGMILDYGSGNAPQSPEYVEYTTSAGYHLPKLLEYASTLESSGFRCLEAIDYTERFISMMEEELRHLAKNKDIFINTHGEQQYHHFVERWERKIRFCTQDWMRAFSFYIEKKS